MSNISEWIVEEETKKILFPKFSAWHLIQSISAIMHGYEIDSQKRIEALPSRERNLMRSFFEQMDEVVTEIMGEFLMTTIQMYAEENMSTDELKYVFGQLESLNLIGVDEEGEGNGNDQPN